MTKENRQKRYEFYVANGDTARAEELKAKYDDVSVKEVKEKKDSSKK